MTDKVLFITDLQKEIHKILLSIFSYKIMTGAHGFVEELYVSQRHEDRGTKRGFADTAEAFSALNKPTQGRYVPTSFREQLPSALCYQMQRKEKNIPPLNSAAAALHVSSLLINTGS